MRLYIIMSLFYRCLCIVFTLLAKTSTWCIIYIYEELLAFISLLVFFADFSLAVLTSSLSLLPSHINSEDYDLRYINFCLKLNIPEANYCFVKSDGLIKFS